MSGSERHPAHVPERTCVACRKKQEKDLMIKVVRSGEGFIVDAGDKDFGRGAYVCRDPECIAAAVKKHAFDRSFKQKLPPEVYDALLDVIS